MVAVEVGAFFRNLSMSEGGLLQLRGGFTDHEDNEARGSKAGLDRLQRRVFFRVLFSLRRRLAGGSRGYSVQLVGGLWVVFPPKNNSSLPRFPGGKIPARNSQ